MKTSEKARVLLEKVFDCVDEKTLAELAGLAGEVGELEAEVERLWEFAKWATNHYYVTDYPFGSINVRALNERYDALFEKGSDDQDQQNQE